MPMVATAVPKMPVVKGDTRRLGRHSALEPSTKEAMSAVPMARAVSAVVSKPTAVPMMTLVAGPVREALAISCTGRQEPAV